MDATVVWSGGYTTICRLCLQQDGFLLAIFNHAGGEHRSIQKKISECTALELSSGDGLPPCVCHRCLYKVELCLEFRQQCQLSDETLRRRTQCNGDGSDQDSLEDFQAGAQAFLASHVAQNVEDVVMVVDPNMDYLDSENESEGEQQVSDNEVNAEPEHLKNVFMCKFCDKAYTNREECRNHETSAHDSNVPFRCNSCDMGFADRTNYTAHQKSVHGNDKPFGCPQCERSFSRRSDLRKHTVVHTGIKPFTCPICLKSFSRNTNLTKHLRIHSGHKPYVCPQCPKTFISKGDLTRHAIIHSGQRPFACAYCDQSFGRRDKLLRHEKRHISALEVEESRNWGETTEVKQELEDYEEKDSWNGENMVISVDPFSGHNFTQTSTNSPENKDLPGVPEHITADSFQTQVRRYPCLICRRRFSSAESLKAHHSQHHSTIHKPHACHLCSKSFLRKRELDRHVATHTGMKPFKCPSCDKRFGRKDKLVRHARIHEARAHEARAHECNVCRETFPRKEALALHMRTHEEPA